MMSKAILEFNMPEETPQLNDALDGSVLRGNLQEFDNWLRGKIKHDGIHADEIKVFEQVRDRLYDIFNDCPIWKL